MNESWQARLARLVVRGVLKPLLHPAAPFGLQRLWVAAATRTLWVPRGARFERTQLAGVPAECVTSRGRASAKEKALLYLHGGGYVLGSARTHRSITGRLALLSGSVVHVPDYRLAPEHPYPAALDDALACYRALLAQGCTPGGIVVAGDSAGGGLALALVLKLRALGLPQPAGLALISPWVDLACKCLSAIDGDVLLSAAWLRADAAAYLGKCSADDPLASPIHADLRDLPRVFIQSAQREILMEDARRLAAALSAAGVPVQHEVCEHMWHDFQLYAGQVPEATDAVRRLAVLVAAWSGGPQAQPNRP
jgi:monoterpene epsilon-lactone hydrolase